MREYVWRHWPGGTNQRLSKPVGQSSVKGKLGVGDGGNKAAAAAAPAMAREWASWPLTLSICTTVSCSLGCTSFYV